MQFVVKVFEELTTKELYELLKLRNEIFVVEQECIYQDLDGVDYDSLHMYLEEDGVPMAYLRAFYKEDEPGTVQVGRVLTREHGKGHGGELLRKSLFVIRQRMRPKRIYLEAQCYAVGYYAREGFHVCTDEFLEDGILHVGMDDSGFYIEEISDAVFQKMQGKSYKADCTIPREELRYVHVLHVGFDGETHDGEIVCNKKIAVDLLEIFRKLYQESYQIERIQLVDEYDADDEKSMRANNCSCFNFRFISYTNKISKHGLGMAIDINPLYNPYVKTVEGRLSIEPATGEPYVDRSKDFPHKIDEEDLAYRLFRERGFEWGGEWTESKDYQHFEVN